jgi:hypothetical protein
MPMVLATMLIMMTIMMVTLIVKMLFQKIHQSSLIPMEMALVITLIPMMTTMGYWITSTSYP